jgi:hypothetical protein
MSRQVKGEVFVDYVRMLRAQKDTDWSRHLTPADRVYLSGRIEANAWYPMDAFERMGLAILAEMKPDMEIVRAWGVAQADWLAAAHPGLVVKGDPRDTLMRFRVLRETFFDFPAIHVPEILDGSAAVKVAYGMSAAAEEAASFQTMGCFEGFLALSGASKAEAWFSSKAWDGAAATRIELRWK